MATYVKYYLREKSYVEYINSVRVKIWNAQM